ncbi:MAG: HEAT repeat domain-containing protein [Candidatus Poribacteria bacterium]|nr:HEAT repeat domain-containing protein [Candidatus Poribacteria bacterium]
MKHRTCIVMFLCLVSLIIAFESEGQEINALIEQLGADKWNVRKDAADGLAQIGEPAIPGLIEALSHEEARVRYYAVLVLGWLGEAAKDAAPELISVLADEDDFVRINATLALAQIGEPTVPALIQALSNEVQNVRRSAAAALVQIGKAAQDKMTFYTVNGRGDLVRLDIEDNSFQPVLIGNLGEPFNRDNVVAEGLAVGPDGRIYAAVNFPNQSELYRIDPQQVEATLVGKMGPNQVDGLSFARDGILYGAISVTGGEIVKVDIETGETTPVHAGFGLDDLDAFAIGPDGRGVVANGRDTFHRIDLTDNANPTLLGRTPDFIPNGEIEGLTFGRNGFMYGTTFMHETPSDFGVSYLVRIDPKTTEYVTLGTLGFHTMNLADDSLSVTMARLTMSGLMEALDHEDDRIRIGAAYVLSQLDVSNLDGITSILIEGASHAEVNVREGSVWALGQIGAAAQDAVPALIGALAEALERIGTPEDSDENRNIRLIAAEALGKIGQPAVPALTKALNDKNDQLRVGAVYPLYQIDASKLDTVLPVLIEGIRDADGNVREISVWAAGRMGAAAKDAVPALIQALHDENANIRESAASALGRMGEAAKDAVPALIELFKDGIQNVREHATFALIDIGESAVPALMEALNHEDSRVRVYATRVSAIDHSKLDRVIPVLIDSLSDADGAIRLTATHVVNDIGEPAHATVPALIKALNNPNPIHNFAAESLGKMGPLAIPPLIEALSHENPSVRSGAVEALGRMGEAARDAVPALIKALDDRDPSVHRSASEALEQIGTPEAVEAADDL